MERTEAVLLLGGNVGEVRGTMARAIALLAGRAGEVLATSREHWTEPWGFSDHRLFLNKAVLLRTALSARDLLAEALGIERELGREREHGQHYAPRTIDIDLLFFGEAVIDLPGLTVPHPRMHERAFALGPAADIVPHWNHPQRGRTVLRSLDDLRPVPTP